MVKQQVNGQGSFKAKDNGQMLLVDESSAQKYSKNKWNNVKGQDTILVKVNGQS